MYLEALNDKEKELFLSLAYNLSAADKDYSPEERVTVAGYCREMGIDFNMDKINLSVDEVLDQLNDMCSLQMKRIIVFEAMRLGLEAMMSGNSSQYEWKLDRSRFSQKELNESILAATAGEITVHILKDQVEFIVSNS